MCKTYLVGMSGLANYTRANFSWWVWLEYAITIDTKPKQHIYKHLKHVLYLAVTPRIQQRALSVLTEQGLQYCNLCYLFLVCQYGCFCMCVRGRLRIKRETAESYQEHLTSMTPGLQQGCRGWSLPAHFGWGAVHTLYRSSTYWQMTAHTHIYKMRSQYNEMFCQHYSLYASVMIKDTHRQLLNKHLAIKDEVEFMHLSLISLIPLTVYLCKLSQSVG